MKLILIPLIIIIATAICVQTINFSPLNETWTGSTDTSVDSPQVNDIATTDTTFTIIITVGFIALFTLVATTGILVGLNISVLGSTVQISERAQKIVYNSMFYLGLWGIFSTLSTVGINGVSMLSIPFGGILYILLTLFYVVGINRQINSA